MIEQAIIISLKITAIYMACQEGMILGKVRAAAANMCDGVFGQKMSKIVQKPLWDCLVCMSSVWTIIFYPDILKTDPIELMQMILIVCGMNAIIEKNINHDF